MKETPITQIYFDLSEMDVANRAITHNYIQSKLFLLGACWKGAKKPAVNHSDAKVLCLEHDGTLSYMDSAPFPMFQNEKYFPGEQTDAFLQQAKNMLLPEVNIVIQVFVPVRINPKTILFDEALVNQAITKEAARRQKLQFGKEYF